MLLSPESGGNLRTTKDDKSGFLNIFPNSKVRRSRWRAKPCKYCLLVMLDDEYGMLVLHDEFLAWSPTRVFGASWSRDVNPARLGKI